MIKNTAGQFVAAHLTNKTDGTDVTAGTTSVFVTKDNGTQVAGSGTVAHRGNGAWVYTAAQSETNAAHVVFTFTNSAAVSESVQVYTVGQDFGQPLLQVDVAQISGDAIAADNLESYSDGTAFMPVDAHAPNFDVTGTTLTVRDPANSVAYTKTVTSDPNADPLTGTS